MPDMQEVYDMITKQTPPRIDPLGDQHRRQRKDRANQDQPSCGKDQISKAFDHR